LALLAVGLFAAKGDISTVTLTRLCIAIPLVIFGAEHLSSQQTLLALVPSYMPARIFWVYFVGFALIAASLSIATGRQVRWSGLLYGMMMFLFVAMLHLPGAVKAGGRIPWTIVFREMSFGGAGFVLAGIALSRERVGEGRSLIAAGRVPIAVAAIFFGVQHFLHPLGLPGVPLVKEMPTGIPARAFIDYVTGALLVVAGICFLLVRKTRVAATIVGAWIMLLVLVIYGPVLIGALADPRAGAQIEGINYFADTLLFSGTILSLSGEATFSNKYRIASPSDQ
jgi:uncharacterized membrane protein YphA (DoxX/SURF4 family)